MRMVMQFIESRSNRTELVLKFKGGKVRFWIWGPKTPQERRQIAMMIADMVSKVFGELNDSWIVHPDGYKANIPRDEDREIPLNRALKLVTEEGRIGFEIRMRRLKFGWSQRELSRRSGVDFKQISLIERGRCRIRETTFTRLHWAFKDAEKAAQQSAENRIEELV
jgi:DNA-binding XRE family transcriptional regulator